MVVHPPEEEEKEEEVFRMEDHFSHQDLLFPHSQTGKYLSAWLGSARCGSRLYTNLFKIEALVTEAL